MSESFPGSPRPTLGIEWEVAFTDPVSRDLVNCAGTVLDTIAATHPEHGIQREFLANTVELVTGVHDTVPNAVADLTGQLDLVQQAAAEVGVNVWSSGSHPFARGVSQPVSPKGHYAEIQSRTQWWGRQMMIWGIHTHIGVRDADRVWPLIGALMTKLPHILALSASSPAWNGEDMGYASNRTMLYQQLPTAGLPPDIGSWQEWEGYMLDQSRSGVISHTGSMHLDIRPASKWGTVEIRVADATSNVMELGSIVAFIHALTVWYDRQWDRGVELPRLQHWHNAENKWRAARYGMDAEIILDRDTREAQVRDDILVWLDRLDGLAAELGCAAELAGVEDILRTGAGYQRQRAAALAAGALPSDELGALGEPAPRPGDLVPGVVTRGDGAASFRPAADVPDLAHTPWVAAVDVAVREMATGRPGPG